MKLLSQILLLTWVSTICLSMPQKNADEGRPYEFGFTIDGEQHRHEKKDDKGIIQGEFGFITADGIYHVTVYATDENGKFKILSMRNLRISAPLDGSPFKGEISPEANKYRKQANLAPLPAEPAPNPLALPEAAPQQEISRPQTEAPGPVRFTTQSTIKPACASCGYVTTTPKPKPGSQPVVQSQNPSLQQQPQLFGAQNTQPLSGPHEHTITPGRVEINEQFKQNSQFPESTQQNNNQHPQGQIQNQELAGNGEVLGSSQTPGDFPSQNNRPQYQAATGPQNTNYNSYKGPEFQHNNAADISAYENSNQANQIPDQQNVQGGQIPNQEIIENAEDPNRVGGSSQASGGLSPQNNRPVDPQNTNYRPFGGAQGPNEIIGGQFSTGAGQNGQISTSGGQQPSGGAQIGGTNGQYPGIDYPEPNPLQLPGQGPTSEVSSFPPVSVSDGAIHVGGNNAQTIPIKDKFPGMQDGLPDGVEETDIKDLLYKFHYTVGFHGHYEKGLKNGAKIGGYFVNGRDGISRVVKYIADENGYRANVKFIRLGLESDETPKPETEKTFGLKSFEFIWYPVS